ncbi:MAG TPA: iron ABC transporter permease [Gemmatimonadales bacterium]|nr:iron ABC transporter permease [Gemmatimonadales bacterium]
MTAARRRTALALALLVPASVIAGVLAGPVALSPGAVWRGIVDAGAPSAPIVRELRVPRVLLAFLVGGSLSIAGAALQALLRNPLADPYLLGLSGGAGLGAVLAIAVNPHWPWAVPFAAFLGAAGAVALVYRLSVVSGRRLDPRVLLLAGVIVGSFAGAVMTAVISVSEAAELRRAFLWLLGGFGGASWRAVAVFTAYALAPIAVVFASGRALDLLTLGEESARHLGADVERLKRVIYVATSLLTAASVAVCGIVGFVGLVVPHAVRRMRSPLHRELLPAAFLGGGAFLVLADALARTVVRPLELPVGAVTALVGVPLFALLLRRNYA